MENSATAAAEKLRIKSILNSDAAKGRETVAQSLAFDTDMKTEAAVSLLTTLPMGATLPSTQNVQAAVTPAAATSADEIKAGWDKAFARYKTPAK